MLLSPADIEFDRRTLVQPDLAERLEWRAVPEAPPLEIDLGEYFSEVLDE